MQGGATQRGTRYPGVLRGASYELYEIFIWFQTFLLFTKPDFQTFTLMH